MAEHYHHATETQYGTSAKTVTAYVIGLVLCVILTLAAFALVGKHLMSERNIYIGLAVLAVAQLWVQVACFLRLNASPEGRWNLMAFLFAILIIAILVAGSLWIMYNLNYNMT